MPGPSFSTNKTLGDLYIQSGAWIMQLPLSMSLARISKLRSSVLFSPEVKASTQLRCSPLKSQGTGRGPKKNNAATKKRSLGLQEILVWVGFAGLWHQIPVSSLKIWSSKWGRTAVICQFFLEVLMEFKGFRPKRSTEVKIGIWNPRLIWCHYLVLNGLSFFVQQINKKYHHYHQHQLSVKTLKTVHELTCWLASTYIPIGFLPRNSTSPPFCRMFLIGEPGFKRRSCTQQKSRQSKRDLSVFDGEFGG